MTNMKSNNAVPLRTAGRFKRGSGARKSHASAADSTAKFVPPESPGGEITIGASLAHKSLASKQAPMFQVLNLELETPPSSDAVTS